jgi:hypothetical protein
MRPTLGSLRDGGQVPLVCAEGKKRPEGRRTSVACSALRVTARQSVLGYRRRWAGERCHTNVKPHLGFEEVATRGCDAVKAHVHGVDCASIVRHMSPPGLAGAAQSLGDTPRQLQTVLKNTAKRRVLQKLTHIGGVQRYKDALRQALADA